MRPPLFVVGTDPVLGRVRSHSMLVMGGAVLGLLAGFGVYQQSPETHTATAAVELTSLREQLDLNPVGQRAQWVTLDTDAQLAHSDAVVLAVAAQQQRSTLAVAQSLSVTARPQSRVLLLHYRAKTQEAARQGAQTAAVRYLEERDRLYVQPHRRFVDDVGRTTEAVDPAFDLVVTSGVIPGRETLRRRAFIRGMGIEGPGRLAEEARMTSVADRGDIEVPLTSGVATGALLALGLGMLLDRRQRSLPAPSSLAVDATRHRRVRTPRRGRVLAGAAVMVILGTGLGALGAKPLLRPDYDGVARVHVPPMIGNAFTSRGSAIQERVDFETEASLARSDEVLGRVADDLGTGVTVDALRARTSAGPAGRAEVLLIKFRASDRDKAERTIGLIAEHIVAVRRDRNEAALKARRAVVEQSAKDAQSDLEAALGPVGDRDMVNALNRRLTLLRSDSRNLLNTPTESGSVIEVRVSRDPIGTYMALGVLGSGALLGLTCAVFTSGGTRHVPRLSRLARLPLPLPPRLRRRRAVPVPATP